MLDKYDKFLRNYINEGKEEQAKMDELLDKGLENLTKEEKALLDRLSAGGKLDPEFDFKMGADAVEYGSEDRDFLNNLLGTNIGPETQVYGIRPEKLGDDEDGQKPNTFRYNVNAGKSSYVEGDKVTFRRKGSDHDGKNGMFLGVREDGKYSIRFDDGKRFAALAKNVFPFDKGSSLGYDPVTQDDEKFDDWRSGYRTPEHFRGHSDRDRDSIKKGDQVQYHNPKSEHNEKIGIFQEKREDGKFVVKFGGLRFTGNAKNFTKFILQLPKDDFYLLIGVLPAVDDLPDMLGAGVFMDSGEMYDQHITAQFPELKEMGFEEETEGSLRYTGDLDREDLIEELKERDFRVETIDGYLY